MPRARSLTTSDGSHGGWIVFCPACQCGHLFQSARPGYSGPAWEFNGDVERPTFTPSILVYAPRPDGSRRTICHSFVKDGQIQFLGDCAHAMAGRTVELPEV